MRKGNVVEAGGDLCRVRSRDEQPFVGAGMLHGRDFECGIEPADPMGRMINEVLQFRGEVLQGLMQDALAAFLAEADEFHGCTGVSCDGLIGEGTYRGGRRSMAKLNGGDDQMMTWGVRLLTIVLQQWFVVQFEQHGETPAAELSAGMAHFAGELPGIEFLIQLPQGGQILCPRSGMGAQKIRKFEVGETGDDLVFEKRFQVLRFADQATLDVAFKAHGVGVCAGGELGVIDL